MMNTRKFILLAIDAFVLVATLAAAAFLLPLPGHIDFTSPEVFVRLLPLIFLTLAVRYLARTYSSIWRYANEGAYAKLLIADFIAFIIYAALGFAVPALNVGFVFSGTAVMANMLLTLVLRLAYQLLYARANRASELKAAPTNNKINIAIVGAGNIGVMLADELLRNPASHYHPYCFIDKDKKKIGNNVRGIKILPEGNATLELLKTMPVQEIVIALPATDAKTKASLYEKYKKTGCKVKVYDFATELSDTENDLRIIRDFKIEELLFRDSIKPTSTKDNEFYKDKVIMVTGGGGSIGGELCRQIAKCSVKELIILDICENGAYEIQQELTRKYGSSLKLTVLIASVRDAARLDSIFDKYRPDMVFHAAAHKHVPLMENNPMEAIKNNVFGTYNTANAAEKYGVKKFILISTDKAVNPTNIMGASKRICEMLIQCRVGSKTEFAAVRFGNVLGSNGSVVPHFKNQILAGGPVTITDKRIIRYFMTIPEAVGLVMKTGILSKGGELFVLDMGKPVKILALAEKMISLMGFVPYKDIDIVEIGMRPGEKLYEELLIKTEELAKTENNMIFIERDHPLSREEIEEKLSVLAEAMVKNSNSDAAAAVKDCVPTFRAPEEVNRRAGDAEEVKCSLGV